MPLVTASPAAAQITRISVATDGSQADGATTAVVLSGNGRFAAFTSTATNLVANDTNGQPDVFVRDLVANVTTRVSVKSDGTQAARESEVGDISDDGNIITFASAAILTDSDTTECAPGVTPPLCTDVYVHDRSTGQTTLISVASDGTQANGVNLSPRITGDGRFVVFESDATNLVTGDTNAVRDVFLHDRVTHTTTRVSLGPNGQQRATPASAATLNLFPTISKDGLVVAFVVRRDAFGDGVDEGPCSTETNCTRAFVRTLATGEVRRLTPSLQSPPPPHGTSAVVTLVNQVALSRDGRFAAVGLFWGGGFFVRTVSELHDLATGQVIDSLNGPNALNQYSGGVLALSADGRYVADGTPPLSTPGRDFQIMDRLTGLFDVIATPPVAQSYRTSPGAFDQTARLLVFISDNPSFVAGDTNNASDAFLVNRDADGDGMLSFWETQFGLNPNDPMDATADPDGDGLTNLQEYQAHSNPVATHTRYFAEGAANSFFATRVAVVNPTAAAAVVTVRLLGSNGVQTSDTRTVLANRRATYDIGKDATLPDTTFSIVIESDQPVVADRLMRWDATGYGSHLETSIEVPGTTWYLAEGATGGAYSLYYLLQNPGAADAVATVTYLRPSPQAPIVKTYNVAAHSRFTIDVTGEDPGLAAAEVSAKITSTQPIVVERAMYLSRPSQFMAAGHDGAAIAAPAARWFLAEGATGFFDEYVLIANAEANAANITVTYLLEGEAAFTESFPVPGNSRYTLDLKRNAQLASAAVSVIVESTNTVPVVVERVMWWPTGSSNWYEASLSAGVTATGTKWAIAEGEQGPQAPSSPTVQTYVLIANTDPAVDGSAMVTLLFEDGSTAQQTVPLPKNSRKTIDIGTIQAAAQRRFGVIVESDGVPIVVERSFYQTWYDSQGNGVPFAAGATSVATNITPVPTSTP